MVTPKDKEVPLPTSLPPVPKFKKASLPSSPTSPITVMCQPPSPTTNPPPEQDLSLSSPYNTIHQELGLYKPNTRLDSTNKFFEVMKMQKMSIMSALAQHVKSYPTTSEIDSYKEDGEVYDRGLRPNDPIFMKDDVPEKFEFDKPFLMSAELSK
jgi:hypothetical protein